MKGYQCLLPLRFSSEMHGLLRKLSQHAWSASARKIQERCFLYSGINPFKFRFIQTLKNLDNYQDDQPCVIMASPGMIQNGLSREIFEKWCHVILSFRIRRTGVSLRVTVWITR